ncbi:hypothetical protein MIR68_008539 [Amoeboaphelidium protococcarum]|nr:hypothetical protein MIR68_008539 [Amoeboaphelidium protococcarum]KAI3644276.1 hypothetical protein MP228_010440 [Amoeboaphelidium protococcarum]
MTTLIVLPLQGSVLRLGIAGVDFMPHSVDVTDDSTMAILHAIKPDRIMIVGNDVSGQDNVSQVVSILKRRLGSVSADCVVISQSFAALFAVPSLTGLVIDLSYSYTSCQAIVHGRVIQCYDCPNYTKIGIDSVQRAFKWLLLQHGTLQSSQGSLDTLLGNTELCLDLLFRCSWVRAIDKDNSSAQIQDYVHTLNDGNSLTVPAWIRWSVYELLLARAGGDLMGTLRIDKDGHDVTQDIRRILDDAVELSIVDIVIAQLQNVAIDDRIRAVENLMVIGPASLVPGIKLRLLMEIQHGLSEAKNYSLVQNNLNTLPDKVKMVRPDSCIIGGQYRGDLASYIGANILNMSNPPEKSIAGSTSSAASILSRFNSLQFRRQSRGVKSAQAQDNLPAFRSTFKLNEYK